MSAATVSIPFVKALTTLVNARSAEAAKFVHWGATSQDVADTAMILLLKRTRPALVADLVTGEVIAQIVSRQNGPSADGTAMFPSGKPVFVNSDSVTMRQATKLAVFSGHVRACRCTSDG